MVLVSVFPSLATEMPAGLTLAAMVGREDPREVLLARNEEGGCQLPFGVNILKSESGWRLAAFLASSPNDESPLRLSLAGPDPDTLAEEAWQQLRRGRET